MRRGVIEGAQNFTYEELTASDTADSLGVSNTPRSDAVWDNLEYLAQEVLQPLRDGLGYPVVVTSGYRGPAVNKVVGGSSTSHHATGCAADIRVPGVPYKTVFSYIYENLPFTELIAENIGASMWIHVAVVRGRESEKAVKYMKAGGLVHRSSYAEVMSMQW